jgi:hypothetical protein
MYQVSIGSAAFHASEGNLVVTFVIYNGDLVFRASELSGRKVLYPIPPFLRSPTLNERADCDRSGYRNENAERPQGQLP